MQKGLLILIFSLLAYCCFIFFLMVFRKEFWQHYNIIISAIAMISFLFIGIKCGKIDNNG